MRPIFAISIAGICVVFCLALEVARRVRRNRKEKKKAAAHTPVMEFFEAGEFRTPRPLWLTQKIAHPGASHSREDVAALSNSAPPTPPPAPQVAAAKLLPVEARSRQTEREPSVAAGSEAVIIGSKLQFVPSGQPQLKSAPDISSERKPPRPARAGTFRRVDLSHYNKDLGDLTDPYTHSVPGSGTQPGTAKNG